MKINDIKKMFGEPKLVTSSYWGGSAYTFYGTNYSDYLYLETYSDGSIASYGSISEGFETNSLSYGDVCDNHVRIGTEATDDDSDELYGVIQYTEGHNNAYENFKKDFIENNRSICKHAVEMWNAISYLYGYDTPTFYDDTLFNINAQLAENGSDWFDYCENTDHESFFQLCRSGIATSFPKYRYPNPLEFAQYARSYTCNQGFASAFIYIPADKDKDTKNTVGFISPDILNEWKTVQYTEEEKELLRKVREYYKDSVDTFNAQTNYYDIEPQYDTLPLTGGKLNKNVALGAVGYLNSIRVGAGLNPLKYSEELSEAAQCKSTYTYYLNKNHYSYPNPHYPPKIDGVDDDFYAKCQKMGGENMHMCGIFNTNVIGSILYALSDLDSTEYYSRGHRYNLLNPNWEIIGVGNTEQQGCHKMDGYVESDVEVVAWPSRGVLPIESGFDATNMLTCKFYNEYSGTNNTIVKVHCKNSGTTWTIDQANLLDGQDMNVSGSLISYMDSSIVFGLGGVYEITFEHLKDAQGEDVSYTYRTVYEKAYLNGATNEDASFNLQLGSSSIKMNPGTTKKINASISPAEVMNKRINWKSADTNVAVVNECGEVTAVSLGNTDIIAVTEDGGITAICRVIVTDETIKDENNEENSVDTTESKTIDTVVKVSKNLKLAKSKISVIKGRRVKFKLPGSLLGKVAFNSKNNKIAAVTKKGIITTKKKGTTRIILKKGKKRAVLTITVK